MSRSSREKARQVRQEKDNSEYEQLVSQRQAEHQARIDGLTSKSSDELNHLAVEEYLKAGNDYTIMGQGAQYAKSSALSSLAVLAFLREQKDPSNNPE